MSAKVMGAVFDLQLGRDEFPVMIALADHAQDDGSSVYPSIGYLAWKTNLSERTVQRVLRKLEEHHLIESVAGQHGGRGVTREFIIHIENGVRKSPYKGRKGVTPSPKRGASKGVTASPIDGERVTPCPEKGDSDDIKRVTATTSPYLIEPSVEPSVNHAASPPRRARDPHWDTQVELFGFSPTPKTPEHDRWQKSTAIWRALNATPDDMRRAARLYVEQFPNAAYTAVGLAGRAEQLLKGKRPANGATSDATHRTTDAEVAAIFAQAGVEHPSKHRPVGNAD